MGANSGPIWGLDLGRLTGFAAGQPGERPRSCSVELAKPGKGRTVVLGALIAFLDKEFRHERPRLVAKEAPMSLGAFKEMNMGEAVVRSAYGLHGVLEGMCSRFGVPWHDIADSTVRKHFAGKGRFGTREATKRAIVSRCWQLGYFERSIYDEDRADACAVFDWAAAHLARVAPRELVLFREPDAA